MKKKYYVASILAVMTFILFISVTTVLAEPKGNDIKALYKGDNAFAHIEGLCDLGPRVVGSPADAAAADYIAAEMESYGLDVEIQAFNTIYFEELSVPVLDQISPNLTVYPPNDAAGFFTMSFSASGDITTLVEPVDITIPPGAAPNTSTSGCEPSDFTGFTPGNIALIQRGYCYFSQKAQNAEAAGAVGVIILNEGQPGRTDAFKGTLGGPGINIPVVGASYAIGEELYNLALAGDVEVHMFVNTITRNATSQNVIGTLEGLDPAQGIVYMGAHYDTLSIGPGANNNASGVAAMLEAARVLSTRGHPTKATLKFIAFGANESGLDGSFYYVVENLAEVEDSGIGMINLDMIGVGETRLIGNVDLAGPDLREYAEDKADAMSLDWDSFTAGANSDHYYFEVVGCPAVFITQEPDPWNNTAEDTPDKIEVTKLEENGELATAVMHGWAKNPALRAKMAAASSSAVFSVQSKGRAAE